VTATASDRGYADPLRVGVALGGVLFAAIALAGRGIGASGAFASSAAAAVDAVAPAYAGQHPYLGAWIPKGSTGLLGDWIVVEILAVMVGAWISARLASRVRHRVVLVGARTGNRRLMHALAGGVLMGAGARLARGCTSGLALTGGALLATGAWVFIPVTFVAAFGVAYLMRRADA
jgi:hypothetical protein